MSGGDRIIRAVGRRLVFRRLWETLRAFRQLGADVPDLIEIPRGHRILVLAPHMDDEVIGCGGTMVKHADRGCAITVAILTDGSLGDPVAEATPMSPEVRTEVHRTLTEIRKDESRAAAKVLGVEDIRFLDLPDGGLSGAPGAGQVVAELVAEVHPDVLYAPFVTDRQVDHRAVAELIAGLARRWPDLPVLGYEVWSPLHATCLVDITHQADRKRQALDCFPSQLAHNDYRHTALGLNAFRTIHHLGGRGFAEAFFAAPARVHATLVEILDRERRRARP